VALGLVWLAAGAGRAFAVAVTDIEFSSRPGSKFEVRLEFDGTPPQELQSYTIEKPARISIDFPETTSELDRKRYPLPYGNATGVLVLESGDRTRLILNLVKLVPYQTRVDGNSLFLTVGQDADAEYYKQESDPNTLATAIESGGLRTQRDQRPAVSAHARRRGPPGTEADRSLRGREYFQRVRRRKGRVHRYGYPRAPAAPLRRHGLRDAR
jgi:hypothetical protein